MDEAPVVVTKEGSLGIITLNRPRALNSLNLEMVHIMDAAFDDFEADPAIAAILITGAGERGLCAGGDIRMVHESGKAGDGQGLRFWWAEYRMNARIPHLSKPYVAFMDGIVMGGGVGVSAHGSHRIATERLKLAMPETGIGFFPDVGATWLLTRKGGELGTYLGLTGEIIGAADAILAGLADFCVASDRLPELRGVLAALSPDSGRVEVDEVMLRFATDPGTPTLTEHVDLIDRAFGFDTIEDILAALNREPGEFAAKTRERLLTRSPTSLKITLRMLRLGRASASLEECINREFAGSAAILDLPDFYEGVRAAVIDKDRNPRWSPDRIEAVAETDLKPFFVAHPDPPFPQV
ncbi:enoyl-CoA hydratase/isomerase family protein [Ciceribacter sp. L1K23]|uniref:enoyl-CoA hydratase/isomerase family protein n=1 Tax=Ciceribacter sp. L1K23 TaxID=2820276 RepID=UPI001B8254AA|nr:enoyl-CoA hydratase/isomerase family protein [Ciceribacter sp. L1K23]MBR0557963.1 enoyl-CoA hydratase/isomerase family protein [Ciceribacter sp. L1K23]